jgi:hypothetical protein
LGDSLFYSQKVEEVVEIPASDGEPRQEDEYVEEWYWEPQWQEPVVATYYDEPNDFFGQQSVVSQDDGITAQEFQWLGVVSDGDRTYTWYSENVLPGYGLTELNENGRHAGEDGLIRDGEGYIAVASSDHPLGTVLSTPFGFAKVYDTGCPSGNIDVYTNY